MTGFQSDLGKLAEHAGEFTEHAEHARRIRDELRTALDASGECWGADEAGARFAELHLPGAERALRRLERLPDELAEMGTNLSEAADTYRRTDEAAAEGLAGIDAGPERE
ncbi:WXG100 family type VII secretion target [Actinopolyspora sp. H202]|uniref:WXG100 family type VII secretion target n=1 Tax=Actinopolyspora sp. H202 TaxID=1500456 RepID=UPI003EE551F3